MAFGTLPARVTAGSVAASTVSITDNDDPAVTTVSFGAATYSATEGGPDAVVTVQLSPPASSRVDIPLTAEGHDGATTDDWSGVPSALTFNTGDTSRSFTLVAFDDTVEDNGEMVELAFGTLPTGFAEGSPETARVTLMNDDKEQVAEQGPPSSCGTSDIWCANLRLADNSASDVGRYNLSYHRTSPLSNLSSDRFVYRDTEHTVVSIYVYPSVSPGLENGAPSISPDEASLNISIGRGTFKTGIDSVIRDHYLDWTLYLDDIRLPFREARTMGDRSFTWEGRQFQNLYLAWTSSTTHRIRIVETPLSREAPVRVAPQMPRTFRIRGIGPESIRIDWDTETGQAVTSHKLQWKEITGSWDDAADVSEVVLTEQDTLQPDNGINSMSTHSYNLSNLSTGVVYTLRVISTNAAGDSAPSPEVVGRTQAYGPRLREEIVNGALLKLVFDQALDESSIPATSAFDVLVHGEIRLVASVSIEGRTVILMLPGPVASTDDVFVRYLVPTDSTASPIMDVGGHYADSTDHYVPVTNESDSSLDQPLMAHFEDVPGSHNGADSFNFRLVFNESVWIVIGNAEYGLLEVTGGSVTAARKVNRRTDLWEITVLPDSDDDVVIAVPADRPCDTKAAPCASGDRRLSNRPEATVPVSTAQNQTAQNQTADPGRDTPATGAPGITGTPLVGETLTVTTSHIADADGLSNPGFAYQWVRHDFTTQSDTDIEGATSVTYTVMADDEGKAIKVRVTFTDDAGNEESLISFAVAAQRFQATPPGAPQNLTAAVNDDGSITLTWDAPDDDSVTGYQILRRRPTEGEDDLLVYVEDTGSTATTFSDTSVKAGIRHVYRVKAINRTSLSQQSNNVSVEPPELPRNTPATGQPTINGMVQVRETLTAYVSGIADADGLNEAVFNYRWLADGVSIEGATGGSYTLAADDEGKTIRVLVSFTDDAGNPESVKSDPTAGVSAEESEEPQESEQPQEPQENEEEEGPQEPPPSPRNLTAEVNDDGSITLTWDAPDDDSVTGYQILRRRPTEGEDDLLVYVEDTGSTATTFSDTSVKAGIRHVYRVKAINGTGLSQQSNYVNVEPPELPQNTPATGQPTINGMVQVRETLTAYVSGIADADGLNEAVFNYRWLADGVNIEGATGASYTLAADDEGKTIRVQVSFTDDAGNPESVKSDPTAGVSAEESEEPQENEEEEGPQEPPPSPRNLTAAVNDDGSITLTWDAPDDDSVTGYRILRRRPTEGEDVLLVYVEDTGSTATTFSDTRVKAGIRHVYRVKAINRTGLSQQSNYVRVEP